MAFLYRYGKYVEWGSAVVIVLAMVAWQLQLLNRRLAGVLVVIGFVAYWSVVLPRILNEQNR
ncbi:hypothetical protein D1831_05730 [Lactiplantibacillus garii]|uniref:Uncharacterized protein n=1 Tax=Lactiplantibacillus garii TaxID=2306423 RepID=A0A3R8L1R9_9LACO|nr:hypothetical protein [Lactiplantibacillus garii]RRK10804.1 hypothetical protein D1831_05730 [Lactiplantibacillus garii]